MQCRLGFQCSTRQKQLWGFTIHRLMRSYGATNSQLVGRTGDFSRSLIRSPIPNFSVLKKDTSLPQEPMNWGILNRRVCKPTGHLKKSGRKKQVCCFLHVKKLTMNQILHHENNTWRVSHRYKLSVQGGYDPYGCLKQPNKYRNIGIQHQL